MKNINEHNEYEYYIYSKEFYKLDPYIDNIINMYDIQDLETLFDELCWL